MKQVVALTWIIELIDRYTEGKNRKLLFETILKGVALANRVNFAESEGKYIIKVEDTQFPVTKFQIFNVCQLLTKWMM